MHRLDRPLLRTLLAVTLVTAGGLATPDPKHVEARPAPLSDAELAATWGGVYGGRIGQENGGILELSCGAEDLWPSGAPELWDSVAHSGTAVTECDVPGRPHFLPRYASAADVSVVVGGVITKLTGTGGTPRIRVFVNGSAAAVATVPCTARTDYPTGTAFGFNSNPNRNLTSWACPDNAFGGNHHGVTISLANAGLRPGLNAVRAVTEAAVGVDDEAQDQEIRFFCVGEDDCLPARVELRPTGDGDIYEFNTTSGCQFNEPWKCVRDYPDPSPDGLCSLVSSYVENNMIQPVRTALFAMGGTVPPGLTFRSCTIKAHIKGTDTACTTPSASLVVRHPVGTLSDGPLFSLFGNAALEYTRTMPTNPFTGAPWTSSDLNQIQVGVKNDRSSGGSKATVSDVLLECEL